MSLVLYYVLPAEGGWIVRLDDRDYRHETLAAATVAAVKAARSSFEKGHEAQVLIMRPDGAWGVAWASDDDTRPGHS